MKTPNRTGPSGRFSSLLRQRTSSSIHGSTGPDSNKTCSIQIICNVTFCSMNLTFLHGCFNDSPDGIDDLAEESVDVWQEAIGEQLVNSRA